jgi:ribonuclease D
MHYDHITTDRQLRQLCDDLATAAQIGFDTEFVSEHTYRPQLCLVQVVAAGRLAVIDALAVRDMAPFWHLLAASGHETLVHAGREELLFCAQAVGRRPERLFDVQLAAGLVGFEYPAGYGSLMFKLLGQRPKKGETRTDWRRRPLSAQQIEYALDDVRYLQALRDTLYARLQKLGRTAWLDAEMAVWQDEVESTRSAERWWKVSGISGLSSRSLAIVRELWRWREAEAEKRDCPTRRVLRDDLIVELAKRRSDDLQQIRAVRGLERPDLQRGLPRLAEAVRRAMALSEHECPVPLQREMPVQLNVLGQFLSPALSSICRSAEIAPSLVGTASDVRDLIAYRMGLGANGDEPPLLGRGWRAEIVGRLIEDLLTGKVSIRIRDPLSEDPLAFDPVAPNSSNPL